MPGTRGDGGGGGNTVVVAGGVPQVERESASAIQSEDFAEAMGPQ